MNRLPKLSGLNAVKVLIDLKEEWLEVVWIEDRDILAVDSDGAFVHIDPTQVIQRYEA